MSEVVTRRPATSTSTSTSTKVTPTRRTENNTSLNLTSQPHNARITRVDVLPTPPQTSPTSTTSTTSEDADYVMITRRPSQSSIIHQPSTSTSSPSSHTTSTSTTSTSTSTSTSTPTLTQYAQHSDYVSMYPVLSSIPGGCAIPMQQFVRDDLYVPTAPLASSDITLLPSTSTFTSPTSTSTSTIITTHTQHIPIHPVTGQRLSPQQLALAKEIQDRNMAYFACVAEAKKEFEKKEAELRALKDSIQHSSRTPTSSTSTSSFTSRRDTATRRKLLSILHDQGMRNDENRMQAFVRHEVVEGDELFGLAIKYGTTPEAIRQYNRRVIFDYLDNVQGEWLHIPIDAYLLTIPSTHYTPEPTKPEESEAKRQAAVVNRQFYLIRSFMDLANDYYYKYLHQYNQTHGINQHRDRTVMTSRDITPAIMNPVVGDDLYHLISPSRPLTDKERAKSQAKRELDAKNAAKQQQKLLQLKATADDIVTEGEAKFYLDENDWNMTRAMASWCDDRNWEQQQHRDMIARSQGNISTINMTTPLESMFTRESAARRDRITQSRAAILNIQNMTLASAAYHRLEDDDEAMARDEAEARSRLALSPPKAVRRYGDMALTQR